MLKINSFSPDSLPYSITCINPMAPTKLDDSYDMKGASESSFLHVSTK